MSNRELIEVFYRDVFNAHNAEEARKYLKEDYIQHNPGPGQGAQNFIDAFAAKFASGAHFQLDIQMIICEGDMVAVYLKGKRPDGSTSVRVVDIYRVEDGKLAEHWDVLHPVDK